MKAIFHSGFIYSLLFLCFPVTGYNQSRKNCLTQYKAKVTLASQLDSFDIVDAYDAIYDTMFSITIANQGSRNLAVSSRPVITYEDEPTMQTAELYFRIWIRDNKGKFVRFNNKHVDIDPVIDPTGKPDDQIISPLKKLRINKHMNPFSTHGNKGKGQYRIQAVYKHLTPCGDYISKSNFLYIKGVQHKPFPKPIMVE